MDRIYCFVQGYFVMIYFLLLFMTQLAIFLLPYTVYTTTVSINSCVFLKDYPGFEEKMLNIQSAVNRHIHTQKESDRTFSYTSPDSEYTHRSAETD